MWPTRGTSPRHRVRNEEWCIGEIVAASALVASACVPIRCSFTNENRKRFTDRPGEIDWTDRGVATAGIGRF